MAVALAVALLITAASAGAANAQSDPPESPTPLSDTDWLLRGVAEYSWSGSVVLTPAATYQLGFLIYRHRASAQQLNVEFSFEIEGDSGADGLALVVARNLPKDFPSPSGTGG